MSMAVPADDLLKVVHYADILGARLKAEAILGVIRWIVITLQKRTNRN